MLVHELIDKLQHENPNAIVCTYNADDSEWEETGNTIGRASLYKLNEHYSTILTKYGKLYLEQKRNKICKKVKGTTNKYLCI